jgi:DNA gyrase subunit A
MLAVKSGRAIRFPEEKVRSTGRGAIGVYGIDVDDTKDEVVGMICINRDDRSKTVLVVSEKGFGKRTPLIDADGEDVYRITNRGGKGVKTINVTEKTGKLVGILDVMESEDLIITCESGITIRTKISAIKQSGRATQGVTLIKLKGDDSIAAISKIAEQEEEEEVASGEELVVSGELVESDAEIASGEDEATTADEDNGATTEE